MMLFGAGFIVTPSEAQALGLGKREGLERHVRPYRHGRDLLQTPRNALVIDLFGLSEQQARAQFPEVYQHVLRTVKPERDRNRDRDLRERWWQFGRVRTELRPALEGLSRYIATVETAKHRIFQFLDAEILPDNKLIAIGSDNAFHLGVLSSRIHVQWSLRAGGWIRVGNDSVYVKSRVFGPFPFPDATAEQRERIAELVEELDATRKQALTDVPRLTMTEIYNWRELIARGEQLEGASLDRATAARAFIVLRLSGLTVH